MKNVKFLLVVVVALCYSSFNAFAGSPVKKGQQYNISTFAGGGNGGSATKASLNNPNATCVDGSGNVYIAEQGNNRIRKLTASTGIISTIAGNGVSGYSGDGGLATAAELNNPTGVAIDGSGNLYISDRGNQVIRKVDASGNISTFAGTGSSGYSGDGGLATSAQLNNPPSVAVDGSGNVYIPDPGYDVVREVTVGTGIITTIAGNQALGAGYTGDGSTATSAQLSGPTGVAVDASGNVYIADRGNNVIREVTVSTGNITTIAGNQDAGAGYSGDGGSATSAQLNTPTGLAVDASGNLYIADQSNNVIREITVSNGNINTIAGNGTSGFTGDGSLATSAQLNTPTGVAVDGSNNLYITDQSNNVIREVMASTGVINTIAGNGFTNYCGDGALATVAEMNAPAGVAVDASGNIYIADQNNNVIRKVDVSGNISTIAGNGTIGYSGDGGLAIAAQLNAPAGVAVDGSGNVYIADQSNNIIRKVDVSGNISTIAGNQDAGKGYSGDGSTATLAQLNGPTGVAVDANGNVYIADYYNNVIRKVDVSGNISTIAGNYNLGGDFSGDGGLATSAQLYNPTALALDDSGNVYIVDQSNQAIRKVDLSGNISTFAGTKGQMGKGGYVGGYSGDGGLATSAQLDYPAGIAIDASGNVYIADQGNNVIREVDKTGIINTIAGNNNYGYTGDGGLATSATINNPDGIAIDGSGYLYIADDGNNVIRKLCPIISTASITASANATICGSGSLTLTTANIIGATYAWSDGGNNSTITAGSGTATITVSPTQTTTYTLTVSNSCSSTTATQVVTVNAIPNVSNATASVVCTSGGASLSATTDNGSVARWFDAATGGNFLGSGSPFTSLSISQNTTFYVEAADTVAADTIGITRQNSQIANESNVYKGLRFNVTQPSKLISVDVFSSGNAIDITLHNNQEKGLDSVTKVATVVGWQTITLNWDLPVGTGYELELTGNINPGLAYTTSGVQYPYNTPGGEVSITTSTDNGTGEYDYFYNWKVQTYGCVSAARTAVNATVQTPPSKSNTNITVNGNTTICSGDSVALSIAAQAGVNYQWQKTISSPTWTNIGSANFSNGYTPYDGLVYNPIDGTPYAIYDANSTINVMQFNGIGWVAVGNAVGSGVQERIAVDVAGKLYVYYKRTSDNAEIVTKFDGTNWNLVGGVPASLFNSGNTSFALDKNGVPYVAFDSIGTNNVIRVSKFDGSNWVTVGSVFASQASPINSISLALNGNSAPYVAYLDNSNNLLAEKFDGTNWVTLGGTITTGDNMAAVIKIDAQNNPYVAYSNNNSLTVAKFDGANWNSLGAGITGSNDSNGDLALDAQGVPYVAYTNGNTTQTSAAKFDGANWLSIGNANFTSNASALYLTFNLDGNLALAFSDGNNSSGISVMTLPTIQNVGANSNSYTATDTACYRVKLSNACGVVTSNQVCVQNIKAILTGPTAMVCPGVTSTLAVSNFNPLTSLFTWNDQNNNVYADNGNGSIFVTPTITTTYTVQATNAAGCSVSSSMVVTVSNQIPTLTGTTGICSGSPTTLTATGGDSYLWSTTETTSSITVANAGSYSVTITNSCGSFTTAQIETNALVPNVQILAANATATLCGAVQLTAYDGKTQASNVTWNTISGDNNFNTNNDGSIQALETDTYIAIVTNSSGCTASVSTSITVVPTSFNLFISASNQVCVGDTLVLNAVSKDINLAGVSYLWSNGATIQQIKVTTAGQYGVTVSNGCGTASNYQNFNFSALPVATILGNKSFCPSGSSTLTAYDNGSQANGDGASSAIWAAANGSTFTNNNDGSIVVTNADTYLVTITNTNGCTATAQQAVIQGPPIASVAGNLNFCGTDGTTITAYGGDTYLWNDANSTTSASLAVTAVGTYIVSVSSSCGSALDTVVVTSAPYPVPSISTIDGVTTAFCDSTVLTAYNNGVPVSAAHVSWHNDSEDQNFRANNDGTITVFADASIKGDTYYAHITNQNGCAASGNDPSQYITINQVATVIISTEGGPTNICKGYSVPLYAEMPNTKASPKIVALAVAKSNYSYSWNTGETTQSIHADSAGTYFVTVTDPKAGCTHLASIVINQLAPPNISLQGDTNFCAGGNTTLSIFDNGNIINGSGTASAIWDNAAGLVDNNDGTITVSAGGTYGVTVTNTNGCTGVSHVTVVQYAPLVATITPNGSTVFNQGGSVILNASAGSSYQWSTQETTQAISVTTSGTYIVTISNSCTSSTASQQVNVIPAPTLVVATITPNGTTTFCNGGNVMLTAGGGSGYLWSTNETTQAITATTNGVYSVTVDNGQGGSGTTSQQITVLTAPTAAITASSTTTFCQGGSVVLTAVGNGSYQWSTNETTQSITANQGQLYTVTISNSCGSATAQQDVTILPNVTASLNASGTTTFCQGGSVVLTAVGSAGNTYLWNTNETTAAITATANQLYTVTVSNACNSTTLSQNVSVVSSVTASISAGSSPTFCAGGSVVLTASGGSQFMWQDGTSNASITATVAGTYIVTVSNLGGCSDVTAQVVVVNSVLASITATSATTFCVGDSVVLAANIGTAYTWQDGTHNQTFTAYKTGIYTVSVTNANGCVSTASQNVLVNTIPVPQILSSITGNHFCQGDSATVIASGGSSYTWNDGTHAASIQVKSTGIYTVTVSNGTCSSTAAISITVDGVGTASITVVGTTTFCTGGSVTLTANAGKGYQWSTQDTTQSIIVSTSGTYVVGVANISGCVAISTPVVVTVNLVPAQPQIDVNGNTLTSSDSTGNQWYRSGKPIPGATHQTYTIDSLAVYYVRVSNSVGCFATSDSLYLTPLGISNTVSAVNHPLNVYPNPFTTSVTMKYWIDIDDKVTLTLMDITGKQIATLLTQEQQGVGQHQYNLNASEYHLQQGMYLLRLSTSKYTNMVKVNLVKE